MSFWGVIFSLVALVVAFFLLRILWRSFQTIPQQERWVIEFWGRFERVAYPGLNLILPGFEQVKAKVPVWNQPLSLFAGGEAVDFSDGSAPVEATAYVVVNDTVVDIYSSVYTVADWKHWATDILESHFRTLFSKLKIDEALRLNKSNLLEHLDRVVGSDTRAALETTLVEKGIRLVRVPLEDISLPAVLVEAREAKLKTEQAAQAAHSKAEQGATEVADQFLAIRQKLVDGGVDPTEADRIATQIVQQRLAADAGALRRIDVSGMDQVAAVLAAALRRP